jgi:hypothetical protein
MDVTEVLQVAELSQRSALEVQRLHEPAAQPPTLYDADVAALSWLADATIGYNRSEHPPLSDDGDRLAACITASAVRPP